MAFRHRMAITAGPVIVALAGLLPVPSAADEAAAKPPAAGLYLVANYVVSASATGGGTCLTPPAGTSYTTFLTYPGPSKAGATGRALINGASGAFVQELKYPTTPAAGVTTWSGSYTSTVLPGGTPTSGTFSSTETFIDTSTYVGTITYVYAVSAGSTCTTAIQGSFVRTGK